MAYTPYTGFAGEELVLRDYLAMDRTVLANDRTLLAYVRTTLAFFAAGASLIQFFDSPVLEALGWSLLPVGAILLIVGIARYKRAEGQIFQVGQSYESV